MRPVRYSVAMSLDGYIADPTGGYDWIVMDPDIDFMALMAQFDTFLIGRKTFEVMQRMGDSAPPAPAPARTRSRAPCPTRSTARRSRAAFSRCSRIRIRR